MERSGHAGRPNRDFAEFIIGPAHRVRPLAGPVAQSGYQAATGLAHGNRTALISLAIQKLVRFDKIRHRPHLRALLLTRSGYAVGAISAAHGATRHSARCYREFAFHIEQIGIWRCATCLFASQVGPHRNIGDCNSCSGSDQRGSC
jgi:hypothetical protein